ncbi:MAG: radical SAM protein [Candidatus Ancaeobacter aquaticus]|nr:radical SAM protein [Candidatus Ancaeobacter aquaticus]
MSNAKSATKKRFQIILIKPSKYDDDGYVIQWRFGIATSGSLACLYSLTKNAVENNVFGVDVEAVVHVLDETIQKIPVKRLGRHIRNAGDRAIVCMVGVQTNQFARALDLCLEFRKEGIGCMIGGFHVSGSLGMLPRLTSELQEAVENGITIVAGEVEERWGDLLKAAYENRLEPVYNFIEDKPALVGTPGPTLPDSASKRFLNKQASFDTGRGCPFKCSFCTVTNVQGNIMRGRSADDVEKIVREQYIRGHHQFFIADDNFARHSDWEGIADRLIDLKENQGIRLSLLIQVDTMAHKIPRFIEKMSRAGVRRVFIGMESVNPDNLKEIGKHQNQLHEYRRMLQTWRNHGVLTCAGYIIGFQGDTYESIMRDMEFLKRELPLDLAEFFIMTPQPGSKDHQKLYLDNISMEQDINLYDTAHACVDRLQMTKSEIEKAYEDAWKSFYSKEHLKTLILRRKGPRRRILIHSLMWFCSAVFLDNVHPLLGGGVRVKDRKSRRRGMPSEPFVLYYCQRAKELFVYTTGLIRMFYMLKKMKNEADFPENADYIDTATTPET